MTLIYPITDPTREERITDDVCDLLHDQTTATRLKVARWIHNVLLRAQRGRVWWFNVRTASSALVATVDVLDVEGDIDRVYACLVGGVSLTQMPLAQLLERRSAAEARNRSNAGTVCAYALESGHRIHLWPAPAADTTFSLLYTVPMDVATVPEEWEPIILDGVLGLYGRHFDRDSLSQDPAFFEQRFNEALRTTNKESFDLVRGMTGYTDEVYQTIEAYSSTSDFRPVLNVGGASSPGVTLPFIAGETLTAGMPCAFGADGALYAATAATADSYPAVVLALYDMEAGDSRPCLLWGMATLNDYTFLPGQPIYLAAAGGLTQVIPNHEAGNLPQQVAIAKDAHVLVWIAGSIPALVLQAMVDACQADAEATAADRVQTGLDVAATAADRVATGEDRAFCDAIATEMMGEALVYIADDIESVTLGIGESLIVTEGTDPYPNITLTLSVPT